MRNKIIIISLLLSISGSVSAQLVSVITDASLAFPTTIDGTIVRNYNDQYAVGYLECKLGHCFYCNNIEEFSSTGTTPLTSGTKMVLACNWEIKDMQVHRDYVYFCGTDGLNHGLFGRVSISDLSTPGSYIISAYNVPSYYFPCFNKLAVVDNGTRVGLVASGYYVYGTDTTDIIMEIGDYNNAGTSSRYALLPRINNVYREKLHDVLTVGDSIVFVGVDTKTPYNTIFLRRSDKHNVFGGGINSIHYYFLTASHGLVPWFSTRSAKINEQIVSIAHLCTNSEGSTSIRIVNIDAINTLNSLLVQDLSEINRSLLIEMKHLPLVNNLVLLHYDVAYNESRYLIWRPFNTTSYVTSILYDGSNRYSSLDLLGADSFISSQRSQWYMQRTFSGFLNATCLPYYNNPISIIPPYSRQDIPSSLASMPLPVSTLSCSSTTSSTTLNIKCK